MIIPILIAAGCVYGIVLGAIHKSYYEIMGWFTALSMSVSCICMEVKLRWAKEDNR